VRRIAIAASAGGLDAKALAGLQLDPAIGGHFLFVRPAGIDEKAAAPPVRAARAAARGKARLVAAVEDGRRLIDDIFAPEAQAPAPLALAAGIGNELEPRDARGKLGFDDLDRRDVDVRQMHGRAGRAVVAAAPAV